MLNHTGYTVVDEKLIKLHIQNDSTEFHWKFGFTKNDLSGGRSNFVCSNKVISKDHSEELDTILIEYFIQ